mgnify:CR=1 FL=1
MQCHTDTATCHSQLGNTGLEECTAEITFLEGMCFLEESVCLVGIGKVGRSNNHIFYLSGESTEHSADAARVATPAFCSMAAQFTSGALPEKNISSLAAFPDWLLPMQLLPHISLP